MEFDDIEPETAIVPRSPGDIVRDIQTRVFNKHTAIVEACAAFAEIEPDAKEPPEEWVRELGPERAKVKFRIAQYALMPAKDSPVGIKVATTVMAGILKVHAAKEQAPRMNAVIVQIPAANDSMPRRVVKTIT